MPIVIMRVRVSGTRDGLAWPAPGEPIEVPEDEAAALVAAGLAEAQATAVDDSPRRKGR